jgi:hypothetical protein
MKIASAALLLGWLSAAMALGQAPAAPAAPAAGDAAGGAADKPLWVNVSDAVLAALPPPAKAKGAFDVGTAGVVVDRTNGDVYMVVNNTGMWKSTDKGATFRGVSGTSITGRCETPFALNMDPAGKRLVCFVVYGSSAATEDGGKTWAKSKLTHLDFEAVDWEASGKAILAIAHESGGKLMLTTDGGGEWKELGKGFTGPLGILDGKTLLAGKKGQGLMRSTDGGAEWATVAEPGACGQVIYVLKGAAYLMTEKGLLVSKDKGATWAIQGSPVKATIGPMFGQDENHFAAVGPGGVYMTKDGGKEWTVAAPLAPTIDLKGPGCCYAWDPVNNLLYASRMTRPTYRLALPAAAAAKAP